MKNEVTTSDSTIEFAYDKPIYTPATDIMEDKEKLVVVTNMPGVKEDQLKVSLENKVLSISGEQQEVKREGYTKVGSGSEGVYKRSFKLETDIDVDSISAELKNGVLTLTLPKSEKLKPRTIEVKAG